MKRIPAWYIATIAFIVAVGAWIGWLGVAIHRGHQRDAAVARADSLTILVGDLQSDAVVDSINAANMRGMLDEWNVYFLTGKVPSFAEAHPDLDTLGVGWRAEWCVRQAILANHPGAHDHSGRRAWLTWIPSDAVIDSVRLHYYSVECSLRAR